MSKLFQTAIHRATAEHLPPMEEIERFGSDGEEAVCSLLYRHFDCVIRNTVVPHKELFLEKDLTVIYNGTPVVLEIKNWKGEIGAEGSKFYQNKENGVRKTLKSPVGTTRQFIKCMKDFYHIKEAVYGAVVFAEPDCTLSLPREMDGIALLRPEETVAYIRACAKKDADRKEPLPPNRLLRCTRLYSADREFCKGILADPYLECYTEDGRRARIDTTRLRYLSVEPQPLRLQDKLYVTYVNGATDVFYNRDTVLTLGCLDGSYQKFALHRIRHIVF
ncbi:MAG: NERD domain-containing protein [Clostridia bacterium]|nr:NERD domain-containing protein [Clostridia bacterium]